MISSKIELEKQAEGALFLQDIHKKRTILAAFLIAAALALLLFLVGLDVWKSQKEAAFAHSELSMGTDRKSTRLNSSHSTSSRMPSSA